MQKIAIVCGGPSYEHEVSINSAKNIFNNLDQKKYDPYFFYISKDLKVSFLKATSNFFDTKQTLIGFEVGLSILEKENFFALLASSHGEFLEDGKIQSLFRSYKIKFSGSDSASSMLSMDKYLSSLIVKKIPGIQIPKLQLINPDTKKFDIKFPVLIKPNDLGSSVGIEIAKNEKELFLKATKIASIYKLRNLLIQEFIENGIEISCGCLLSKNGIFTKLPPIEIHPNNSSLFDYKSKYEIGGSNEITPPVSISKSMSNQISDLACQIHEILGLSTYSRSDFIVKGKTIYYLETNTLPGMTTTSLLPKEAEAIGINFSQLLDFIIKNGQ